MNNWYVYIMTNKQNGVIYTGVTDDLESRVWEHKLKVFKNAFSARYNCDKLVCFEEFDSGSEAALREKRMKKWKREWKVRLIEEMNPGWMDIALNWHQIENSVLKTKRFLPTQE
ncbi:GIY-YIG nuclease family protein [Aureitalea sp. L0-47]|uniref:GIY-YIG nuclease family protein n=1 Tax=Aureitalea sp. L0-47 TaxID=2816962 RepID=UPI002238D734|nr:GIY-YIG nuclease family protein [Aureitalea sp. L0-47]MCW5520833.1 GIY-YIG nuclease family protein [Aureitalea sp. L0-47]